MKIALKSILIPAIIGAFATTSALAQNTIYRYNAESGALVETIDYPNGFTSSDPLFPSEMLGKTWLELLSSPNTYGANHSSAPGAFNWASISDIYYSTGVGSAWFFSLWGDPGFSATDMPITFSGGGAYDGQTILGNSNMISMGNHFALYTPGSNRITLYFSFDGTYSDDADFSTFTGGIFDGVSVDDAISSLVGINLDMYLVGSDGNLHIYSAEGNYDDTLSPIFSGGVADGMNFSQLIQSGHFLGLESGKDIFVLGEAIPEPSTYMLIGGGALVGLMLRRKMAKKAQAS